MALSSNQLLCDRCFEWNGHALRCFADGTPPPGCQLCERPFAQLQGLANTPTTRMYMIPIDGIYAVACATCKEAYTRKRADLYTGTAYGKELGF
jgi:hypothetical protein